MSAREVTPAPWTPELAVAAATPAETEDVGATPMFARTATGSVVRVIAATESRVLWLVPGRRYVRSERIPPPVPEKEKVGGVAAVTAEEVVGYWLANVTARAASATISRCTVIRPWRLPWV
jgi:hypothetical protein